MVVGGDEARVDTFADSPISELAAGLAVARGAKDTVRGGDVGRADLVERKADEWCPEVLEFATVGLSSIAAYLGSGAGSSSGSGSKLRSVGPCLRWAAEVRPPKKSDSDTISSGMLSVHADVADGANSSALRPASSHFKEKALCLRSSSRR